MTDQLERPRLEAPPTRRHRRRASERVRRNRALALLIGIGLLVVVVVAVPVVWFLWHLDPPGDPGDAVAVRIQDGWGVRQIGDALADDQVVGSSLAFQLYAGVTRSGPFQAGEYELQRDMGVRAAARELEAGPEVTFQELAVPPGLRLVEIAERVGELSGLDAETFLTLARSCPGCSPYQPPGQASLEGLLYPDTYLVADHEDERAVLDVMLRRFDEVAVELGLAPAATGGIGSYETVIVASLIESEAVVDGDRPKIARVVANRLADGMPLQIDATVLYAIGARGRLQTTPEERAVQSPFNTYAVAGLPPTPISSVTAASLEAALAPAEGPWRYYVLIDEDGRHAFAATLAEHEQNVARARELDLLE